jgi:iron(III) transport system substrate-binding protein
MLLSGPVFAAGNVLRMVTSLDPLEAAEYIKKFESDTGVKVQWIRLSSGEALARLVSEARHPVQDVWFGAPDADFIAAREAGLLEKYSSRAMEQIASKWKDPDGYWTGIYFGTIAFAVRNGTKIPKSWQDLLDPEFKGEIEISYPYTAGTGYAILAGLVSLMGEEKALDYYQKLDAQLRRYTKSGSSPVIDVGLGEANVGIVFAQDAMRKGVARGFPIVIRHPDDGVIYEIGGTAIIKGGNKAIAGRFIDWITSLSAQNMMQKWYRTPLHPRAGLNPVSTPINKFKFVNMDFNLAGSQRERLIKIWRERVGK